MWQKLSTIRSTYTDDPLPHGGPRCNPITLEIADAAGDNETVIVVANQAVHPRQTLVVSSIGKNRPAQDHHFCLRLPRYPLEPPELFLGQLPPPSCVHKHQAGMGCIEVENTMGLPGCGALAELLPKDGQSVTPVVGAGHGQNAALIGSTNPRAVRTGRIPSQNREGRSGAFLPEFSPPARTASRRRSPSLPAREMKTAATNPADPGENPTIRRPFVQIPSRGPE